MRELWGIMIEIQMLMGLVGFIDEMEKFSLTFFNWKPYEEIASSYSTAQDDSHQLMGALPQQQRYFSLGLNSALQLFVKSSQPVLQVRILEICTLMAVRLGMGDPW
ncbi:hypothetical protein C5167_005653, partial [Papaver somniferum]